jgi:hypothetical protein
MRFGVVVFPGSNCDRDCYHVIKEVMEEPVEYIWHKEKSLSGFDALILPGGFSYGDYLRTGAIARFSPIMPAVMDFAQAGGLVLGICNGFQILLEAGLLPGAMLRNSSLKFICPLLSRYPAWITPPGSSGKTPVFLWFRAAFYLTNPSLSLQIECPGGEFRNRNLSAWAFIPIRCSAIMRLCHSDQSITLI